MAHFESYNTSDPTTGATPLAANATLPNPITIQAQQYGAIAYSCKSDQPGTLTIAQSFDGVNYDWVQSFNVTANTGIGGQLSVIAPFVRVNYTNGITAQTYLRLFIRVFGQKTA